MSPGPSPDESRAQGGYQKKCQTACQRFGSTPPGGPTHCRTHLKRAYFCPEKIVMASIWCRLSIQIPWVIAVALCGLTQGGSSSTPCRTVQQ